MKIIIETIPHSEQRYDTVGDWQWKDGSLYIKVTYFDNLNYSVLIGIHEVIEAVLCSWEGVSGESVDRFDIGWESPDLHISEPGEDSRAPYYSQHQFASGIERILAARMGIIWSEYERVIGECCKLE